MLEHCAQIGRMEPHSGTTNIFLSPGSRLNVVGALLTNFHLPKSTLLMLVSAFAGRELELTKALTTLGRPGVQVAAITRRSEGYFIVHVDSGKENDFPQVNGVPIGPQARRLNDNDVVQLAGVKMGFFES